MITTKNLLSEVAALRWTPWYRWHPQLAVRYLPVVEKIKEEGKRMKEEGNQELKILEVGSGGLGIVPYLKQPITGVDLRFDPPIHPFLTPIVGDATKLKFPDNSFDIVISMDMLEHLPKAKRQRAVSEIVRVARVAAVIGVPCGKNSSFQDERLRLNYRAKHGKDFPFLQEQVEYGLPNETDILGYINSASHAMGKNIGVAINGNTNLQLRAFFMKGWMSTNLVVNLIFRKVFLLLIPLFRFFDQPPYYRKVFFVRINKQ